jgi:hypothetical protein
MIKARSYITPPDRFRYPFKNVIEAWKQFCVPYVIEYSTRNNSCEVFSNSIGVDHSRLSPVGDRSNVSLSIEQMLLLEKIQGTLYPYAEDVFKVHLGIIHSIHAASNHKPKLKESVAVTILENHREDLEWLKENYYINFLHEELKKIKTNSLKRLYPERVNIREIYQVDEKAAELYEVYVMDLLLTKNCKPIIRGLSSAKKRRSKSIEKS